MAATATARSTAAKRRTLAGRAAASKRAVEHAAARPRRRARHTPITGFPVAAAGAVGGIADSGLVVRLTRSRLWIGLLGALLVGIVALNVVALNFSASSSDAARQAEELERVNSGLRAQISQRLSSEELTAAANELGLSIPPAGSIRYLRPATGDAAEAARRLRSGELGAIDYAAATSAPVVPTDAPVAPTDVPAVPTETEVAEAPTETAMVPDIAPVAPEPETEAAAPAVPAEPVAPAPETVSGGGVASP